MRRRRPGSWQRPPRPVGVGSECLHHLGRLLCREVLKRSGDAVLGLASSCLSAAGCQIGSRGYPVSGISSSHSIKAVTLGFCSLSPSTSAPAPSRGSCRRPPWSGLGSWRGWVASSRSDPRLRNRSPKSIDSALPNDGCADRVGRWISRSNDVYMSVYMDLGYTCNAYRVGLFFQREAETKPDTYV